MLDGYDKGEMMDDRAERLTEILEEWFKTDDPDKWKDYQPELAPDDDELMYQYDNEIDEYTAEESWS